MELAIHAALEVFLLNSAFDIGVWLMLWWLFWMGSFGNQPLSFSRVFLCFHPFPPSVFVCSPYEECCHKQGHTDDQHYHISLSWVHRCKIKRYSQQCESTAGSA